MPVPDQSHRSTPFSRSIQRERNSGFYETCNMSYRRDVLERVGGFDEDFRYPWGEDTDLAWRAIDSGCGVVFNSLAEVFHEVWPFKWSAHLADIRRQEGLVLLVRKHPRIRELFPMPWCAYRRHSAGLGAVGAAAMTLTKPKSTLRWLVAAAAVANYYYVCRVTRWRPRKRKYWPGYLPAMLASDLAEVGVMAAASAKYRTLLL
jgi:GT2 family glycosyltransferase